MIQDRYVGDFGKYGLLRSLSDEDKHGPALRLGLLWYRFDGMDQGLSTPGGLYRLTCYRPWRLFAWF